MRTVPLHCHMQIREDAGNHDSLEDDLLHSGLDGCTPFLGQEHVFRLERVLRQRKADGSRPTVGTYTLSCLRS